MIDSDSDSAANDYYHIINQPPPHPDQVVLPYQFEPEAAPVAVQQQEEAAAMELEADFDEENVVGTTGIFITIVILLLLFALF